MKKLATALVSAAAIMTMSTTSFAAENPAEVFDRVMEKNNTIQSGDELQKTQQNEEIDG